jgi:hypothetical protein
VRSQLLADFTEIEQTVDPAQQVIRRHMVLKTEIVEKTTLIRRLTTHHPNALPIKTTGKTESRQLRRLKRLYQRYQPA